MERILDVSSPEIGQLSIPVRGRAPLRVDSTDEDFLEFFFELVLHGEAHAVAL